MTDVSFDVHRVHVSSFHSTVLTTIYKSIHIPQTHIKWCAKKWIWRRDGCWKWCRKPLVRYCWWFGFVLFQGCKLLGSLWDKLAKPINVYLFFQVTQTLFKLFSSNAVTLKKSRQIQESKTIIQRFWNNTFLWKFVCFSILWHWIPYCSLHWDQPKLILEWKACKNYESSGRLKSWFLCCFSTLCVTDATYWHVYLKELNSFSIYAFVAKFIVDA